MLKAWQCLTIDVGIAFVSIVLALMLRLEIVYVGAWLVRLWPFILLVVIIRPLMILVFRVDKSIWRHATLRDFSNLLFALLTGTTILTAISLLWLHPHVLPFFPRSILFIETITSAFLFGGFRLWRKNFQRFEGEMNLNVAQLPVPFNALVVGAGSAGAEMAKEFRRNPLLGLRAIAFLDDDVQKIGGCIGGIPIYGPLVKLSEVAEKNSVDEVVIAIPSAASQTVQNVKSMCREAQLPYSSLVPLTRIPEQSGDSAHGNFKVSMAQPDITAEEIQSVIRVMQSRNLSISSQTTALEEYAASVAGTKYGVAVVNGTSGLHLCMVAAGVGPGDEVITTPYSFIASANCVLFERATPVFVDIDPLTLNLDPAKVEAAITDRTKVILPVHIFGQPADLDPILKIAEKHNLLVIEDAAEAIGAHYKGRPVGGIGRAGVFAFYPNKQMTTGEGAVIVTNDKEWADLFRSLRNQGRDIFNAWLCHARLGYNYRMSELNAALGVVQMRRLDTILEKRARVAQYYCDALKTVTGASPLQVVSTTTKMSWFVFVVRLAPEFSRNKVMEELGKRGIPARPYFSPIHLQPFYVKEFGYQEGAFPEAEAAGQSTLALPFHNNLNEAEVQLVVDSLVEVIQLRECSASEV